MWDHTDCPAFRSGYPIIDIPAEDHLDDIGARPNTPGDFRIHGEQKTFPQSHRPESDQAKDERSLPAEQGVALFNL